MAIDSYPVPHNIKSQIRISILEYSTTFYQIDIANINQKLLIIFSILIYFLFIFYIIKKNNMKINPVKLLNMKNRNKKENRPNRIIRIIFKNYLFAQYFYRLYSYKFLLTGTISSLILTYYLVNDSIFNNNSFIYFPYKYNFILFTYFLFVKIFDWIINEMNKIHEFEITNFIDTNSFYKYISFLLIYLSIGSSLLITITSRNVYYILEKYGAIIVPQNIQTVHYMILFYGTAIITLYVSKKINVFVSKKLEVGN